jgi:ABC-2 type transport system ATP-binding protein
MAVLAVENLRKSFGKSGAVVRDVSFSVDSGELFAFLGPNGAGKTTTIKMIAGLLHPDTGAVRIDGIDPHASARAMVSLGTVLEGNRNLYWRMTAFENLRYFGVHKGMSLKAAAIRADQLLERFGLAGKRNSQVGQLSRGMQQKLAIAVTLIHQPKLLLLDEPTLGLDVAAAIQVVEILRELREQGMAIVLTTHQLDVAEALADRVAIIREGRIIKEATKADLIEEFTPDGYQIQVGEEIGSICRDALISDFGARIDADCVHLPGNSERLYEALNLIRPLPITSLGKIKVDLAQIFLRLTEAEHANV